MVTCICFGIVLGTHFLKIMLIKWNENEAKGMKQKWKKNNKKQTRTALLLYQQYMEVCGVRHEPVWAVIHVFLLRHWKDKIKTGDMMILRLSLHLHSSFVIVILDCIGKKKKKYIYISLFYCLITTRVQEGGFRCEGWMSAVIYYKTFLSVLTLTCVRRICGSTSVPRVRWFLSHPDCFPSDGALSNVEGLTWGRRSGTECSLSSGHSSPVWRENRVFMHSLMGPGFNQNIRLHFKAKLLDRCLA